MADPNVTRPPSAAEARAEVEAGRARERVRREARFATIHGDGMPGRGIVVVSWMSTVLLAVVTAAAVIDPDAFVGPFFIVAVTWFLAGSVLLAVDVALAAGRSRESAMGIGGLFFLVGSAPRRVQWHLLGSLLGQAVVGVAGAAVRPFTPLAFGTLAPVLALGFCGLWGVRHGLFPERRDGRGD